MEFKKGFFPIDGPGGVGGDDMIIIIMDVSFSEQYR
jgi:hypothetical protein